MLEISYAVRIVAVNDWSRNDRFPCATSSPEPAKMPCTASAHDDHALDRIRSTGNRLYRSGAYIPLLPAMLPGIYTHPTSRSLLIAAYPSAFTTPIAPPARQQRRATGTGTPRFPGRRSTPHVHSDASRARSEATSLVAQRRSVHRATASPYPATHASARVSLCRGSTASAHVPLSMRRRVPRGNTRITPGHHGLLTDDSSVTSLCRVDRCPESK